MNKCKGVIFDLDGVIVDTVKYHFLAWRKIANDMGFDISSNQNEQLKGVSRVDSLKKVLEWAEKEVSPSDFENLLTKKNKDYLSRVASMNEEDLLPGIKRILDFFLDNNIPFALGSSSRNARRILKSLKISNRFEVVVDGTDVKKAKPDPGIFLLAADKLHLKPEECMVFEDSVAGIQAANFAGMTSIGIGDRRILQEAHFNFNTPAEIELLFLKRHLVS